MSDAHQNEFQLLAGVRAALRRVWPTSSGPLNRKLIVAVSGGEDSHVLLNLLCKLREELGLGLVVAHFDHRLRPESAREADFVRQLSVGYDVHFVKRVAGERPASENIEAWARRVRYDFLEQVRKQEQADYVVTAHHLNDQAETVLFRMLTGRLSNDAQAIAGFDEQRRLIRPLLHVAKSLIEDYSLQQRMSFVVDSSNFDEARSRSRIRHDLLPKLEQDFNPQLVSNLGVLAERLGADEDYLRKEARRIMRQRSSRLDVRALLSLPSALQWRVLSAMAEDDVGEDAGKLGFRAIQSVIELLARQDGSVRRLDLGFGIRCEVSRDRGVAFQKGKPFSRERAPLEQSTTLPPQSLDVPGLVERRYGDGAFASITAGVLALKEEARENVRQLIDWTRERSKAGCAESAAVEYFDFETLTKSSLLVRERRNGDVIQVWKRGERKLKKLFLERQVSHRVRDHLPLIQAGPEILWVPGVARAKIAPISPSSRYVLELRYSRLSN